MIVNSSSKEEEEEEADGKDASSSSGCHVRCELRNTAGQETGRLRDKESSGLVSRRCSLIVKETCKLLTKKSHFVTETHIHLCLSCPCLLKAILG